MKKQKLRGNTLTAKATERAQDIYVTLWLSMQMTAVMLPHVTKVIIGIPLSNFIREVHTLMFCSNFLFLILPKKP